MVYLWPKCHNSNEDYSIFLISLDLSFSRLFVNHNFLSKGRKGGGGGGYQDDSKNLSSISLLPKNNIKFDLLLVILQNIEKISIKYGMVLSRNFKHFKVPSMAKFLLNILPLMSTQSDGWTMRLLPVMVRVDQGMKCMRS